MGTRRINENRRTTGERSCRFAPSYVRENCMTRQLYYPSPRMTRATWRTQANASKTSAKLRDSGAFSLGEAPNGTGGAPVLPNTGANLQRFRCVCPGWRTAQKWFHQFG